MWIKLMVIKEGWLRIECKNSKNRYWNREEIRIYLVYNRVGRCFLLINQEIRMIINKERMTNNKL